MKQKGSNLEYQTRFLEIVFYYYSNVSVGLLEMNSYHLRHFSSISSIGKPVETGHRLPDRITPLQSLKVPIEKTTY